MAATATVIVMIMIMLRITALHYRLPLLVYRIELIIREEIQTKILLMISNLVPLTSCQGNMVDPLEIIGKV